MKTLNKPVCTLGELTVTQIPKSLVGLLRVACILEGMPYHNREDVDLETALRFAKSASKELERTRREIQESLLLMTDVELI